MEIMVIRSLSAPPTLQVDPVVASMPAESRDTNTQVQSEAIPYHTDVLHKEKYELSISDQAVRKAFERANKVMEGMDRRFEYSVHEKTGDVIVKVVNKDTNEVIREIPNEKFLDLIAKLQELVGLNIDEKR